jgi:hypothetical protein
LFELVGVRVGFKVKSKVRELIGCLQVTASGTASWRAFGKELPTFCLARQARQGRYVGRPLVSADERQEGRWEEELVCMCVCVRERGKRLICE